MDLYLVTYISIYIYIYCLRVLENTYLATTTLWFNLWLSTEANLLRSYSALTDEVFKESNKPDAKQRMVESSWKSRGKFQRNSVGCCNHVVVFFWKGNVGNFRVTVVWYRDGTVVFFQNGNYMQFRAILNKVTRGIGNLMLQDKYVKACIWEI